MGNEKSKNNYVDTISTKNIMVKSKNIMVKSNTFESWSDSPSEKDILKYYKENVAKFNEPEFLNNLYEMLNKYRTCRASCIRKYKSHFETLQKIFGIKPENPRKISNFDESCFRFSHNIEDKQLQIIKSMKVIIEQVIDTKSTNAELLNEIPKLQSLMEKLALQCVETYIEKNEEEPIVGETTQPSAPPLETEEGCVESNNSVENKK